jgi:hypothetical protein
VEEKANDPLNTAVATDISIADGSNGGNREVIAREVEIKHTIVLIPASFYPGVSVQLIILEVTCHKNP